MSLLSSLVLILGMLHRKHCIYSISKIIYLSLEWIDRVELMKSFDGGSVFRIVLNVSQSRRLYRIPARFVVFRSSKINSKICLLDRDALSDNFQFLISAPPFKVRYISFNASTVTNVGAEPLLAIRVFRIEWREVTTHLLHSYPFFSHIRGCALVSAPMTNAAFLRVTSLTRRITSVDGTSSSLISMYADAMRILLRLISLSMRWIATRSFVPKLSSEHIARCNN